MADKESLKSGLSIISTCRARTGDIWDAHIGAAAIASYFFMKDNDLPKETAASVARQAKAMVECHHGGSESGVDCRYAGRDRSSGSRDDDPCRAG